MARKKNESSGVCWMALCLAAHLVSFSIFLSPIDLDTRWESEYSTWGGVSASEAGGHSDSVPLLLPRLSSEKRALV